MAPFTRHTIQTTDRSQLLYQVTCLIDGVVNYGYIPITGTGTPSQDPLPEEVVWLPGPNQTPADYMPWMMVDSTQAGMPPKAGKGGACYLCDEFFPRSKMSKIRGKWYCIPNGCAEEMK